MQVNPKLCASQRGSASMPGGGRGGGFLSCCYKMSGKRLIRAATQLLPPPMLRPPPPRMVPHLHGAEHVAAAAPQPCRGVCSPRRAPALAASRLQGSVLPRTPSCPSPAGMAPAPRPPPPGPGARRHENAPSRGAVLHRWSSPSFPPTPNLHLQKPRICKQRGFGVHRRPGFAKNVNILKLI